MEHYALHIRHTINVHKTTFIIKENKILKKTALRLIAASMVMILLIPVLAGCRGDTNTFYEQPEYVYIPDFIDFPDNFVDVRNLVFVDDVFYFSAYVIRDRETWDAETKIFSMNADGTNIAELVNYDTSGIQTEFEDAEGNIHIMSLNVDNEGNLWIAESGYFYRLNVPEDFDGDEWDMWNYWEDLGNIMVVRKLDRTGAEISSINISNLSNEEYFYVNAFNVDGAGNLYVGTDREIYVFNNEGNMQFKIDVNDWVDQLIRMPDGSVAFFGWIEGNRALRSIDYASNGWGELIDLPYNAYQIYPGGGDYLVVFSDGINLNGVDVETGESVRVLNWIESNVLVNGLGNVSILPDGRVVCTNEQWDRSTGDQSYEMIILRKVPFKELPQRTVLTLATVWLDWELRNHIVYYNRANQNYRIHVIDYAEYATEDDWRAGITKLSAEIISGNVPDMLDVSNLPFKQYVARGLLEDLYPLIDSDPELSRSSFMESVFRAAEMDGGLYRIFPSFGINTLIGHPSVVGPGMGWNMEEFKAVLDANPQADMPMGRWLTKESFLQTAIWLNIDDYVDWATGEVRFDSRDFVQLLEFANTFPAEFDYSDDMGFIDENELIATGRQIMSQMWLSDFNNLQWQRLAYGGDIVFKGFPNESRNGNTLDVGAGLAITTRSSDKDGSWQFLRSILTEDWQKSNVQWRFPTNRAAFDMRVEEAMAETEGHYISWGWGDAVELKPLSQEDLDQIMLLIDTVAGIASYDEALMNIIMESTSDFFNGRRDAPGTARVIQDRVSTYVSEQS